jgi:hypothetical protein
VIRLGSEQNAQLAKHQIVSRDFYKKLVVDLAQNNEEINGIPVHHIEMAEKLVNLGTSQEETACFEFLLQKNHFSIIVNTLHNLFVTVGNQVNYFQVENNKIFEAMTPFVHWANNNRFFYTWFAIGSFPVGKLKETFRDFKSPALFEKHLQNLLDIIKSESFHFSNTICSWITEEQAGLDFAILRVISPTSIEIRSVRSNKIVQVDMQSVEKYLDNVLVRSGISQIWKMFSMLLNHWPGFWKQRKSNCFGLLDLDYDVVKVTIV